jgi:EmrB/QacA subfamily drug resistance transporter
VTPTTGRGRWLPLLLLASGSVASVLDLTVLTVAVPTIQRELGTSLTTAQWVLSGYSLVFASLMVLGGRIGDLFGSRRVFLVGMSLFGAASLLGSMSQSVVALIVSKALLAGVAAALMIPATVSLLSSTFTGSQRVSAFATWGTLTAGAAAFGPFLGGYLTTYHSWRWALRGNVVLAVLALVGCWVLVRPDGPRTRARLDLAGAALVAMGSCSLVFALSQGHTFGYWMPLDGHPRGLVPALFLLAAVTTTGFVVVERWKERRDTGPLVTFGQLTHVRYRFGLGTNFLLAFGQFGSLFCLSVYLQRDRHLDAFDAGLWLLPYGVAIFAGARLSALLGRRRSSATTMLRTGAALAATAVVLLAAILQPAVAAAWIASALVLYGIGSGFMTGKLMSVALSDVEPAGVGSAGGLYSTVVQIGASLGFAVVGAVVAGSSTRSALFLCAASLAGAFLVSLRLPADVPAPAMVAAIEGAGQA